jgi:hypothetical protein
VKQNRRDQKATWSLPSWNEVTAKFINANESYAHEELALAA